MKSRAIALLAVAAAASLSLAACSGGASGGTGNATHLTIQDYFTNTWDPIYQKCAKQVGAKITVNHVPFAALIPKVLQQASSRTLPDVLLMDNPDVQQIAAAGALSPLSDYGLSGEGDVPAVTSAGTYKGKLYGLEPVTNSIGLYYNVKMLKDAGVTPPKTWDELRAAAKKLTHGKTYGFAMSNINTAEGTWQFLPFFWSNGGDEKNIATPQAAEALQFVSDLQSDGSMSKSSINWGQPDVNNQFIAGNAAMMINGPWQLPALKAAKGLEFASVPIPTKTGEPPVAPLGGETATVPLTKSKDTMALAGKFVGCLNSPDMQSYIAGVTGNVPTNEKVADAWAKSHPEVAAFVTTTKTARARTGELGADWPKAATKIYTAVQATLTGKASPMDALQAAQSQSQ